MSTLIPLSFPQDKNASEHQPSSFPYPSILGSHHQTGQPAADSASRMQQLENMLKEVQGRAEVIEKEAYDQAYLAGEKAGMALGKKRAEQIIHSLQESLQGAEGLLIDIQGSFAEAAMDVAEFIAKKIIANAVQEDKSRLWQIAKQATEQLPNATDLRIAVSPDDFFTFNRLLEEDNSAILLSSDAAVESGTCRIISSQQDILIDPVAAVDVYLRQLSPGLLQASKHDVQPGQSDA